MCNDQRHQMGNPGLEAETKGERVGVIDIGSNSVRLVIFQDVSRIPVIIFTEKVICGLGRRLVSTGLLDTEGEKAAIATIRRFTALAREMSVTSMDMVATAAVREARNGADFVARVADVTAHGMKILSAEEEARFAAYGILSGIPDADGLAGDLGGGSLELVQISGDSIGESVTLPIGPLRLIDAFGEDRAAAAKAVHKHLKEVPWLSKSRSGNFYAIGGAWRAFARLYISQEEYPLRQVHQFSIPRSDATQLAQLVGRLGAGTLTRMDGVASERRAAMPYAAIVLEQILRKTKPRKLIFSSFGIREGILYSKLPERMRAVDPLIDTCRKFAIRRGRFAEHGDELMAWIAPLFRDEDEVRKRLRHAACLLSDVAWRGHPEYRAELALSEILYTRFLGVDHRGQAMLALALFACYGGSEKAAEETDAAKILDAEDLKWCRAIGMALRLGQRVSGGTGGLLSKCSLERDDGRILLSVAAQDAYLLSETVQRRLTALGNLFSLATKMVVNG